MQRTFYKGNAIQTASNLLPLHKNLLTFLYVYTVLLKVCRIFVKVQKPKIKELYFYYKINVQKYRSCFLKMTHHKFGFCSSTTTLFHNVVENYWRGQNFRSGSVKCNQNLKTNYEKKLITITLWKNLLYI